MVNDDAGRLPSFKTEPGHPALVEIPVETIDDACAWLQAHREELRAGLDEHGAVFLRGLPVRSAEDFARVRDAVITERAQYRENATPRSHFGADVYSSTDLPPAQSIRPHNENSYTLTFPGLLLFCCLIAPEEGGATPVTDVRKVRQAIPAALLDRFREHGWALVRNYREDFGLGWTTAFASEDPADVAKYCQANLIAHEWDEDGGLRTVQRRSALITHPRTGQEVWFNHAVFWNEWSLEPEVREIMSEALGGSGNFPYHTVLGTGEPLDEADVRVIDEAYRAATVRESWRPGDVMIVDNILAAHGREAFKGDRKILVAMGDPVALADCRPTVQPLAGFAG
ncbi:TauD/TfdA family dioxygenase [Catenulispora rubra]|uniref:TauD/TfdA family dioxygenase n=1 Tax=Catenulispora rubra TaxID=280293 RepID=UPI002B26F772|nr:TauD/TfdA family dioxygenase [Catenulispora rubra]